MGEIINYLKRNNGSEHIVEHIGWHESGDYLLRLLFARGEGFRQHKYEVENEYDVIEASEVEAIERNTCPRRMGEIGGWEHEENRDYWGTLLNGDKVCSFCGSLSPDDVIRIMKEYGNDCLEPSTKSYKWYVNQPGVKNATEGGIKYYKFHDTPEFISAVKILLAK